MPDVRWAWVTGLGWRTMLHGTLVRQKCVESTYTHVIDSIIFPAFILSAAAVTHFQPESVTAA
jgi:hypothetical protein